LCVWIRSASLDTFCVFGYVLHIRIRFGNEINLSIYYQNILVFVGSFLIFLFSYQISGRFRLSLAFLPNFLGKNPLFLLSYQVAGNEAVYVQCCFKCFGNSSSILEFYQNILVFAGSFLIFLFSYQISGRFRLSLAFLPKLLGRSPLFLLSYQTLG